MASNCRRALQKRNELGKLSRITTFNVVMLWLITKLIKRDIHGKLDRVQVYITSLTYMSTGSIFKFVLIFISYYELELKKKKTFK